jgi:exopolyphosphatase/guanosine-5'-triphosphate,3'-diphosphate pyrophosphatase
MAPCAASLLAARLAARPRICLVKTTGDGPPFADADAPLGHVVPADLDPSPSDPMAPGSGKLRRGRPVRGRKHRRHRRRPVYAPGMGPRAGEPILHSADPLVNAAKAGSHPASSTAVPAAQAGPPTANGTSGQVRRRPAAAPPLAVAGGTVPFYAALDLGTNNCRLLVAAPRDHGFRVVDAFSRIVRLGEGIGQTGRLSEAAMGRAIEALKICAAKLAERQATRARLIATEACRAAANGLEFIERVRAETGLELEIVSRETEARLAVAGCAALIDPAASGAILFDIGGGSSELVWIDLMAGDGRRRRMADRIRNWMSLPVGVVNISERHGGRHVTPHQFESMVAEVAAMLHAFPEVETLDQAVARGNIHMLGTSGTVTTLAGVHLGLPRYDRRRVDGTWLTGTEVAALVTTLAGMDYEARVANPCIGRERADLVLAGCAILEAFRRRWPVDRLRVADRGLREGVLVELMAEDGVWRPRSGRRAGEPPQQGSEERQRRAFD